MRATELARRLYEAYQMRDWDSARALLHDDATVDMPATGERLTGAEDVIGFQRRYPEPWGDLTVLRVVGADDLAATEIEVVAPEETFRLAAFWRADGDLLRHGVEY